MSPLAFVFIVVAVGSALAVVIGAVAAAIVLRRVGEGLRAADERLAARALTLPVQLQQARESIKSVDAAAERSLWSLGKADDRMDRMRVDLTAKRFASDSLRLRLLDGQLSLARLRDLIRLLIRLDKIRREFI